MNVFPVATAAGSIHNGTMAGKLNGVMPAHTPRGWRTVCTSTSVDACSLCMPFRASAMPQANSMFSMPRATSPRASSSTLPCSAVRARAMSSAPSFTRRRKSCNSLVRRASDDVRHSAKAALADRTARSTSSTDARPTRPASIPVAGLNTGPDRPEVAGEASPSMR